METLHYPVMYKEVIEGLSLENRKVVVDCTIGVASHSLKLLEVMDKNALLIGIDKDGNSLGIASRRLKNYDGRFKLFEEDFRNLDLVLDSLTIDKADVFFFDLGISSFQLSDSQRGFSFLNDGPLDMRMDMNSFVSAGDLINNLSESELNVIFKKFGEERFSRRIAHRVVEKRKSLPITTTVQLSALVLRAIPSSAGRFKIHPATRVFQALRIAVNRELDSLEVGLKKAIGRLSPGGRIAVLAFHSLEDRIVKHTFRGFAALNQIKIITKKPLIPCGYEVSENVASRSAKLRIAEKV